MFEKFFGQVRNKKPMEEVEYLVTSTDPITQAIYESKLQDAEIPYITKERASGSVLKVFNGYSLMGTDFFVNIKDLEVATELIKVIDNEASESEEETKDN